MKADQASLRQRLVSTITGRLVTAEDDMARLLAGQVTRPVLFAQAMARELPAESVWPPRKGGTSADVFRGSFS